MADVRPPAVAGLFYPADPARLRAQVRQLLAGARAQPAEGPRPEALIVPHAGYQYSGPVAASAYVRLEAWRGTFRRVVLVGPAHHVPFRGLAASTARAFDTPLGEVPVEPLPAGLPGVIPLDRAHAPEHCLEVQLPFLHEVLGEIAIIPLLAGLVAVDDVAHVMAALRTPDTLLLVSSDLSHYLMYEAARQRDAATAAAITRLDAAALGAADACGATGVRALLQAARTWRLRAETADLRNSGDTSGGRREVVGYGAFVFTATDQAGGATAHQH